MAIFFLSKDSRICCSSLCVGRSGVGTGACSLLPRPSPSPQGPPGTAAQRTLSLGRAPAVTAAQVPRAPGAGWLPQGTVGKALGRAQGCGQLEVLLRGSGTAACSRLPRPGPCSLSAPSREVGTAALAPGGPPVAPEGPGSAFSGGGGRKVGGRVPGLAASQAGSYGSDWPMECTHQTVVLLLQLQKGLLCRPQGPSLKLCGSWSG